MASQGEQFRREQPLHHPFLSYLDYVESLIRQQPQCELYLGALRQFILKASMPQFLRCICASDSGQFGELYDLLSDDAEQTARQQPWIVAVEGLPAPETIRYLGHRYRLRPEVFLGHLELERVLRQSSTSFELPSLPSTRDNVNHIRMARLGRFAVRPAQNKTSILEQQTLADIHIKDREKDSFERDRYGDPRFRKFNVHSEQYFSLEQLVTFSVGCDGTAIIFLDQIITAEPESSIRGLNYDAISDKSPSLLPVVNYNVEIPLDASSGDSSLANKPAQRLRNFLDSLQIPHDPKFPHPGAHQVLYGLYRASLSSWSQILNMVEQDTLSVQTTKQRKSLGVIEQLRCNINFLGRTESSLEEHKAGILNFDPSSSPADLARKSQAEITRDKLLIDYNYLLHRCRNVLQRCETTSELLTRAIEVNEAKKSMEQAERVEYLTKLAFIFIPLSFTAGVFGMNVREIQSSYPPLWSFFVVAVGTTAIAMLPLQFTNVKRAAGALRSRVQRRQEVKEKV